MVPAAESAEDPFLFSIADENIEVFGETSLGSGFAGRQTRCNGVGSGFGGGRLGLYDARLDKCEACEDEVCGWEHHSDSEVEVFWMRFFFMVCVLKVMNGWRWLESSGKG